VTEEKMSAIRSLSLLMGALLCWLVWPAAAADKLELQASLVDMDANAAKQSAVVRVEVVGAELIDPELAKPGSRLVQAHLHYQVDDGPVIATPVAKLAFHGLASGKHRIEVVLADSEHKPLGPSQTLEVMIPANLVGQQY
jgi:hypothetical protein